MDIVAFKSFTPDTLSWPQKQSNLQDWQKQGQAWFQIQIVKKKKKHTTCEKQKIYCKEETKTT
jgi:hypothetical protein